MMNHARRSLCASGACVPLLMSIPLDIDGYHCLALRDLATLGLKVIYQHFNSMKTIVACTDFSQNATHALRYAAALANAIKGRLVLFHHFTYPIPTTDLQGIFPNVIADEIGAGLEQKLKELSEELALRYSVKVDCVVRSWDFLHDLEDVYKSEKASLVMMGTHGQSAMLNALYGSMTSSAIRHGKLPLMIVPQGVDFHPVKKILFPFDDRTILSPEVIRALRDLAIAFDAHVEVFTMFDLKKTPNLVPQDELSDAKKHLETLFKGVRHGYSYENEHAIVKGILNEAARDKVDLVAMISHHHSFLSNLLNLSETQRVATTITLPLLVLGEMAEQLF